MNLGIRILPLPSANGLFGWRMSGQMSWQPHVLRMGNCPWRRMNHKLANGMRMWKGIGNTTTLLFSLKGLEILHQERRGQVKTILLEHFNGILFHKSGPANNQHNNQSIKHLHKIGNNIYKTMREEKSLMNRARGECLIDILSFNKN